MKSLAKIALWGSLLVGAHAFGLLDTRDQTCSDGGVCLTIDGNVCCEGGPIGGCMFSTGVCCQNGYFCYEGQFCSTTDVNADDSSGLDTNCCQDEACNSVIGLAPYIIPYSLQPDYSGASGSPAATSTGSTPTVTGSEVSTTTTTGAASSSPTAAAKTPPTTSVASSAASPTSSKTSGAGQATQSNIMGAICAAMAVLGLGSLLILV